MAPCCPSSSEGPWGFSIEGQGREGGGVDSLLSAIPELITSTALCSYRFSPLYLIEQQVFLSQLDPKREQHLCSPEALEAGGQQHYSHLSGVFGWCP